MKRTLDPAPFNELANDPEVRPWLGFGRGQINLAALIGDPHNFCFLTDTGSGGYVMERLADGLYEAHTISRPGRSAVAMARLAIEVLDFMFAATDAVEITTKVPDGHDAAAAWAAGTGFEEVCGGAPGFILDDKEVGISIRSLTYQRWAMMPRHQSTGEAFHNSLRAVKDDLHPDDKMHDRWVGATVRTCRSGQAFKGVVLYNRWALQAGYAAVTLVSTAPVVVDIGDAIVHLNGEHVEILTGGPPPCL